MLFRIILPLGLVFSIAIPAWALKKKEAVVHIGEVTKVVNRSTSCNRKDWGLNDENACRCCISKHFIKGDTAQKAYDYCKKSSKHCTDEAIANIVRKGRLDDNPVRPTPFVQYVVKSANLLPQVEINEDVLKGEDVPKGQLSEKTTVYFLQLAARDGFIQGQYAANLAMGSKCIRAERLGSGGAQTLQLFSIEELAECRGDNSNKTIFILKEMKKPVEEVVRLQKVKQTIGTQYSLDQNPKGIALAFDYQNLSYELAGNQHYLALLSTAPGRSIKDTLKSFRDLDEAAQSSAATELQEKFCAVGSALGKFHMENMEPKDAIFGKTIVHGDIHTDNLFVDAGKDGPKVTLIDNETMALSLERKDKKSPAQDLIRLFAHSTSRFLGKSKLHKEFPSEVWNNVFNKPFLTCYAHAYPADRLEETKKQLVKIFSDAGILALLKSQGALYNPVTWAAMKKKLISIVEAISLADKPASR